MTTAIRYARMWHEWRLGESRIIRTLDRYQIQSQVGKCRKKHPECIEWRWTTKTLPDGVEVTRVR